MKRVLSSVRVTEDIIGLSEMSEKQLRELYNKGGENKRLQEYIRGVYKESILYYIKEVWLKGELVEGTKELIGCYDIKVNEGLLKVKVKIKKGKELEVYRWCSKEKELLISLFGGIPAKILESYVLEKDIEGVVEELSQNIKTVLEVLLEGVLEITEEELYKYLLEIREYVGNICYNKREKEWYVLKKI